VLACYNKYRTKYFNVLKQETSLVVHIRDVVDRFVQAESVNKLKSTGRVPESKEAVDYRNDWSTTYKYFAIHECLNDTLTIIRRNYSLLPQYWSSNVTKDFKK
jgi:hypothetical protein